MAESEQSQRKARRPTIARSRSWRLLIRRTRRTGLRGGLATGRNRDVLEVNAEEFVRSFVQKGGQ